MRARRRLQKRAASPGHPGHGRYVQRCDTLPSVGWVEASTPAAARAEAKYVVQSAHGAREVPMYGTACRPWRMRWRSSAHSPWMSRRAWRSAMSAKIDEAEVREESEECVHFSYLFSMFLIM